MSVVRWAEFSLPVPASSRVKITLPLSPMLLTVFSAASSSRTSPTLVTTDMLSSPVWAARAV